ncbi:DNA binding HTH domain Psq-type [Trinorchestia longiramus]|nr:DNA binding HTH domain Psq-type [Trinorchestia longiramus]
MARTNKIVKKEKKRNPKRRKSISIAQKLEISKKIEDGVPTREIACMFQLAKSTVDTIKANRERILECASSLSTQVAGRTMRTRNSLIHLTETLLHAWILDESRKGATLKERLIRTKALSLFKEVKAEKKSEANFPASHGWFKQYIERFKLSNILLKDESPSDKKNTAAKFVDKFKCIVSEGGYSPQQVFNFVETGLDWEKLPSQTHVSWNEVKLSENEASNHKVTLLLGGNASGDAKLKPLLLYHMQSPGAPNYVEKDALAVVQHRNSETWVTKGIFSEWFNRFFVPFVEKYNAEHCLENKALLLLQNASGDCEDLHLNHPHIKVVFIPSNASSLLQPMDQGITSIFKSMYLQDVMSRISTATSKSEDVLSFWKQFDIEEALEIIRTAWDRVTKEELTDVWKAIWPECVQSKQTEMCNIEENSNKLTLCPITKAGFESTTAEKNKTCSIEMKLEILKKFASGMRISQITKSTNFPISTVKSIVRSEKKNRVCAKYVSSEVLKRLILLWNQTIQETETRLFTWISNHIKDGVFLTAIQIRKEAMTLFQRLSAEKSFIGGFTASPDWFQKFKKLHNLKHIHLGKEVKAQEHVSSELREENSVPENYDQPFVYNQDADISMNEITEPGRKRVRVEEASYAELEKTNHCTALDNVGTVSQTACNYAGRNSNIIEQENVASSLKLTEELKNVMHQFSASEDSKLSFCSKLDALMSSYKKRFEETK